MRILHFEIDIPPTSNEQVLQRINLTPPSSRLRRRIFAVSQQANIPFWRLELRLDHDRIWSAEVNPNTDFVYRFFPIYATIDPGQVAELRVISTNTTGLTRVDEPLNVHIADEVLA